MRNIVKRIISVAIVMVFSINVFAFDTGTGTVKVPSGGTYVVAKTNIKRSGNYGYAMVKANSVYPIEENTEDTYTRCYTQLYYGTTAISEETQLVEGHLKKVKIFEGQMKRPTFRIKFKGNNPNYGANIAYYYNGK